MALKRIAFGAASLSVARVFQLAGGFVALPFLARMLTPNDFGLVALAMSMVMFTLYVGDAGLGRSLVRTSAQDVETWSSAHWMVVLLTCCLGLAIAGLASPAARFFDEPRLAPLMLALAAAPVLLGLVEIPASRLLQEEKFQTLAAAEFASAVGGIGVALLLAFLGFGVWALVWQNISMRIIKAMIILPSSSFRARYVLDFGKLRDHFGFAIDNIGWSITSFISRQTDTLVIGKLLGASTLGLYNIASRIMMLPVYIVGGSLQSAFYPRMAKLRQDLPALRQVVLAATMAQAAFVFPPMAAVAASSEAFFKILFSDRWLAAGPLFTLLAAAGAIQTITALNASLLQAIGRTRARLQLTVEFAILWATSAFILGHFGVEAVALGCSVVTLLYLPRLLQLYVKPIGCTILDFFHALLAPVIVAIAIFAAHRAITMQFEMDSWPEVGLAAIETVIGYGLLLWFGRRTLIERLQTVRAIVAKEPIPSEPAPASQPS